MSEIPAAHTVNSLPPDLDHQGAQVSGALNAPTEDGFVYTVRANAQTQGNGTENAEQRSSLEALIDMPPGTYGPLSDHAYATSTALPESIDGQSFEGHVEPGEPRSSLAVAEGTVPASLIPPKSKPVAKPYADAIKSLQKYLPHLNNVLMPSRRKQAKVECYDYSNDRLASRKIFNDDLCTDEDVSLCQVLASRPSEDLQLRLIVAEDLSTELIECLGSSLNISPEVFEEHLLNGGWHNGIYNDPESDTWITQNMVKNFTTLRWFRPVKRKLLRPYSPAEWEDILHPREPSLVWTETVTNDDGKSYRVSHLTKPSTNILRRGWDLTTNSGAHDAVGGSAAWEERATIWTRHKGSHSIVVLLLDPLPILQDQMKGAEKALEQLGVYAPVGQRSFSQDQQGAAVNNHPGQEAVNPAPHELFTSRTFVRPKILGRKLLNLRAWLTDKLRFGNRPYNQNRTAREAASPSDDPERGQRRETRDGRERTVLSPGTQSGVASHPAHFTENTPRDSEGVDGTGEPGTLIELLDSGKIRLGPLARCMFEGTTPRGPVLDYDSIMSTLSVGHLAEHMDNNGSTAKSLALWIQRDHQPLNGAPLESLFAIVQRDTVNLLCLMDLALREIGQDILDDTRIQQRLIHWRHLLQKFDTELLQLEGSLRRFAKFLERLELPKTSGGASPGTADLLEDCFAQISTLGQRTRSSYKSLMANMSIVESKRGIAEAESVTKLTELAFLFLPLTFSASIFSMQVKELNSSRVSLSAFFILAVIMTTCSYALRLFIRSASVIRFRRHYMAKIRADAGLPLGASIPTTSFLIWIWRRIGVPTAVITVIAALLVVPLAFLWTRDMNHGYQAALTVLQLTLILGAAYFVARSLDYIDTRGFHLRKKSQ